MVGRQSRDALFSRKYNDSRIPSLSKFILSAFIFSCESSSTIYTRGRFARSVRWIACLSDRATAKQKYHFSAYVVRRAVSTRSDSDSDDSADKISQPWKTCQHHDTTIIAVDNANTWSQGGWSSLPTKIEYSNTVTQLCKTTVYKVHSIPEHRREPRKWHLRPSSKYCRNCVNMASIRTSFKVIPGIRKKPEKTSSEDSTLQHDGNFLSRRLVSAIHQWR